MSQDTYTVGILCCSVLQCVAVRCSVLQTYIHTWHLVLQSVAVCSSVLQCVQCVADVHTHSASCVAVCCSVLQCVAVCCSVLHCVADIHTHSVSCVAVCCSVLQCVAVCCSVLQTYIHTRHPVLRVLQVLQTYKHSYIYTLQHTATQCNTLQCILSPYFSLVYLLPLYLLPLSPPHQPLSLPCSIQRLLMVCAIHLGINAMALEQ